MSLRNKLITEENKRSFLVSDTGNYEDKNLYVKFQVHGPVKDQYIITKHSFGSFGSVKILDILPDEQKAIEFAYKQAKKYAEKGLELGVKYEDRTSFKRLRLKTA